MEPRNAPARTIAHPRRRIQAWRRLRRHAAVLLTLPMMIAVPVPPDSTSTRIGATGTTGEYFYRGLLECNSEPVNEVHRFHDAAVVVEHAWPGGAAVRGSLGRFSNPLTGGVHGALSIGYERRLVGLGAGVVASDNSFDVQGDFVASPEAPLWLPTFSLRLGPARGVFFSAGFMDQPLVYSPLGYAHAGLGTHRGRMTAWLGVSSEGPWDAPGVAAALQASLRGGLRVGAAGRIGHSHEVTEWGASVSLEIDADRLR